MACPQFLSRCPLIGELSWSVQSKCTISISFFFSFESIVDVYLRWSLEYLIKKEIFTMTSNYYIVWNASMTRLKATESNWEQLKIVMSSNVWSFNLFENDPSLFVQWHLYQIRMGASSSFMTVVICGQALQNQVI